jgi:hypothetical protein
VAKETPRAKALRLLQQLVRMKAADDSGMANCVTCGKSVHYKDADGGHFIPKGSSSRWALEECNVHLQCKGCNGFGMKHGSAAQAYTIHMIDLYGKDWVEHMLATKNSVHKIYKADYEDMISEYKAQIKIHQERLK